MNEFQPGDIAMLKSGGPYMTVAVVDGSLVKCEWFATDDDCTVCNYTFCWQQLLRATDEQPDSEAA